jgi:hypothetical protein
MGQYFTPTFLDSADRIVAALNPDDYGSGLKLYGHTRHDAALMRAVEALLRLDGNIRLVWAGDYADDERDQDANLYFLAQPTHFVRFSGLVVDDVAPTATLPDHCTAGGGAGFLCNADKRRYIDTAALPLDDCGVRRNPLPHLTAEGGGRPGPWARDRLFHTATHPGPGWTAEPTTAPV